MINIERYLNKLKNTQSTNEMAVYDAMMALKIVKHMMQGGTTHVRVSAEAWVALGKPPAQQEGNRYIIDTTDSRVVGLMWGKSVIDAMNLGCYAVSDISDAIGQIMYDNEDHVLTDREALTVTNQMLNEGMKIFQEMHTAVGEEVQS